MACLLLLLKADEEVNKWIINMFRKFFVMVAYRDQGNTYEG
jgi:hypothetical protein